MPPVARCVRRSVVPREVWDTFVAQHPQGWFWHSSRWIDYALAYTPGASDQSGALVVGDEVAGLHAVVIAPDGHAVNGGQPSQLPLIDNEYRFELTDAGISQIAWRPGTTAEDAYIDIELPPGCVPDERRTYVVDLGGDEADIWRRVRKSYRGLIRQAERACDIQVTDNPAMIAHAQRIHLAAVGFATRSDLTWRYMGEWLEDGIGVLAVAKRHSDADWSGFGYAIRWKGWAYWASGRTLVPDLQHAIQWAMIRALRADGVTRRYELGWAARPEDDAKTKGISLFKAGFGGESWPVLVARADR